VLPTTRTRHFTNPVETTSTEFGVDEPFDPVPVTWFVGTNPTYNTDEYERYKRYEQYKPAPGHRRRLAALLGYKRYERYKRYEQHPEWSPNVTSSPA
jgi:hypothetical protein